MEFNPIIIVSVILAQLCSDQPFLQVLIILFDALPKWDEIFDEELA